MGIFDRDDTEEKLSGLIKIGEISSIDPAKGTARVVFDDEDSIVSYDLPVLQRNTLETHDFYSPVPGEDAVCVFLSPGSEDGFIIGSIYAGNVTPPENTEKKRTTVFADGTRVSYDMDAHELTVNIEGTTITANRQDVNISTPAKVNINGGSEINILGGEKISLTAPSIMLNGAIATSSQSGGAGTMNIKGQVSVEGAITTTGDNVAGGVSLVGHTHTCPEGGTTSSPN